MVEEEVNDKILNHQGALLLQFLDVEQGHYFGSLK